jgi:hypothetical protein
MDVGSIIHGILLGGGAEVKEIDAENFRTKAAQDKRDEARTAGKIPILKHKYESIKIAAEQMRGSICVATGLDFSQVRTELTAIWNSDDCPCRARLDSLSPTLDIYDLKTCSDASTSATDRGVFSFGYFRQAAANVEAVETLIEGSAGRVKFHCLFTETTPPYGVIDVTLDGAFMDLGARQWKRAKTIWAQCLKEEKFPNYAATKIVHAPAYALNDEMGAAIAAAGQAPF